VSDQQLVERPASDLRGDARCVGGERVDQRFGDGTMGLTAILLPADDQPDPLQATEQFVERGEP
jgi:hypothetical protein